MNWTSIVKSCQINISILVNVHLPLPLPNIYPSLISVDCCWGRGGAVEQLLRY